MKRSYTAIPLAIALLLGAGMLGGCEKSKEAAPRAATTATTQAANAEGEDGVVSEKLLDELLQGLPEFMADKEYVTIRKADGGYLVALNTDNPIEPATEDKIVCSAKEVNYSFAICVKNHVLANGCGILQHGAGGWTLSNCPN